MTILLLEGFEGAGTTEGSGSGADMRKLLEARYDSTTLQTSTNGSPRVGPGWGTGKCLTWGDDGNGDLNTFERDLASTVSEIWVGFALKPWNQASRDPEILRMRDIATNRDVFRMRIVDGTALRFLKETFATYYQSRPLLKPSHWQYIEVRVLFSGTVGQLEVKINGVQVINETGLDNDAFGTTTVDRIQFYGGEGTATSDDNERWHIDDLYVDDAAFQDPMKIEALLPTAEGATINFTPSAGTDNSANVDENPRNDDTDYNSSADTASNKDLLTCANLTQITGGIQAVQISAACKLDAAGSIGMQGIVAEGTPTQGTGPIVEVTDTTNYVGVQAIFETNPDTAAAWAVAEVDGMEIGYEVD
jgi:hypothetical protein